MTLDKKTHVLIAAFALAVAGGASLYFSREPEKKSAPKTDASQKDKPVTYATLLKETSDGVFQVRAHTWVSQYAFTTLCLGDIQYDSNKKPLCNEQAEILSGEKPAAGKTLPLSGIKSLGTHVPAADTPLPATRPRQDRLKGPVTAKVTHLVDGDTIQIAAEPWPGHFVITDIRIGDLDTPEKGGKAKCSQEATLAEKASAETKRLVEGKSVTLMNVQFEKYGGRVLADVMTTDGKNLAAHLVEKGLARRYDGKTKESWCRIG